MDVFIPSFQFRIQFLKIRGALTYYSEHMKNYITLSKMLIFRNLT